MESRTNPYEVAGRIKKANAIADVLAANGYRSGTVAGFNDEQWGYAAAAARVKPPKTEETRLLVVKFLRQRETAPSLTPDQVERVFDSWRERAR